MRKVFKYIILFLVFSVGLYAKSSPAADTMQGNIGYVWHGGGRPMSNSIASFAEVNVIKIGNTWEVVAKGDESGHPRDNATVPVSVTIESQEKRIFIMINALKFNVIADGKKASLVTTDSEVMLKFLEGIEAANSLTTMVKGSYLYFKNVD